MQAGRQAGKQAGRGGGAHVAECYPGFIQENDVRVQNEKSKLPDGTVCTAYPSRYRVLKGDGLVLTRKIVWDQKFGCVVVATLVFNNVEFVLSWDGAIWYRGNRGFDWQCVLFIQGLKRAGVCPQ